MRRKEKRLLQFAGLLIAALLFLPNVGLWSLYRDRVFDNSPDTVEGPGGIPQIQVGARPWVARCSGEVLIRNMSLVSPCNNYRQKSYKCYGVCSLQHMANFPDWKDSRNGSHRPEENIGKRRGGEETPREKERQSERVKAVFVHRLTLLESVSSPGSSHKADVDSLLAAAQADRAQKLLCMPVRDRLPQISARSQMRDRCSRQPVDTE
ncbi:hypothetical protein NQZ68_032166 [Dissostichus eleginoides]|nr:hypothetical protein NQZ68_032166 [Dissostichus eleginoides]